MFAGSIYFDTDQPVIRQLDMLRPLLRSWIGEDYLQYYLSEIDFFYYNPNSAGFSIALKRNAGYGKSTHDQDRFRYCLSSIDMDDQLSEDQHLQRMTQVLELLWSQGIPTCTPGWTDELPNGGGEEGPVRWP